MEMNRLKKYRGLRGITLRELAEKTGLNPKTISFIENDRQKATIVSIGKLARALDINIEELIPLMDTTAAERGRKGGTASSNLKPEAGS